MQEPVEPMEQLKPIANINIENGALEFNNVEFKYDVKRFLIMYHFVYLRGDISAFVGPSGSGKSTILI